MSSPKKPTHRIFEDGSYIFEFSILKEEWLGLAVSHNDGDHVLQVQEVFEDGAIGSWNKLCRVSQGHLELLPLRKNCACR